MATVTTMSKIPTKANSAGDKVTPTKKITITSLTVGADTASASPSASAQS